MICCWGFSSKLASISEIFRFHSSISPPSLSMRSYNLWRHNTRVQYKQKSTFSLWFAVEDSLQNWLLHQKFWGFTLPFLHPLSLWGHIICDVITHVCSINKKAPLAYDLLLRIFFKTGFCSRKFEVSSLISLLSSLSVT